MAHFAKISEDNKVLSVLYVNDSDAPTEEAGQKYLEKNNHWPAHLWIQTSYNTYGNQHKQDGTPFRGNYAGIGMTWDSVNQIFWGKSPFPSWVKHIPTATWKSPIGDAPAITAEMQTNQQCYKWNEDSQSWDVVSASNVI
jgi:hypothetical protein